MTGSGANQGGDINVFPLPPRRKTILVKYSRRSKLATAVLALTGFVSLVFLLTKVLPEQVNFEAAKRHAPRMIGAENQGRFPKSSGQSAEAIAGVDVQGSTFLNQQDDRSVPMVAAPDFDLTENTPAGDLPKISEDGRQPWQVYSRPFNSDDKRPRLAIVIADLGMQRVITDDALALPASVTLAFDAQSPAIGAWSARARQEGHEILLSVPMEPFDFPQSDPGPHTLLTSLPNSANLEKLNWALRQASGYTGIMTMSGSKFTTETDKLKPVIQVLQQRGLMVLDTHIAPHSSLKDVAHDMHVPIAIANERIDDGLTPEAIDSALEQLEQAARLNGKAVGVFAPLPVVVNRLQEWLKTLPREGIALAPVSAVIQ